MRTITDIINEANISWYNVIYLKFNKSKYSFDVTYFDKVDFDTLCEDGYLEQFIKDKKEASRALEIIKKRATKYDFNLSFLIKNDILTITRIDDYYKID